jgi:hypothetical protein
MPVDFKGTVYNEKIQWGNIYWPAKNNLQITFFGNLETKFALCVYGEHATWRKKNIEIKHISVNYRTT